MASNSSPLSSPACLSIAVCARDPWMSCRHNRQSNETDSVNRATSAAGPPAKRSLRQTGVDDGATGLDAGSLAATAVLPEFGSRSRRDELLFISFERAECAPKPCHCHWEKVRNSLAGPAPRLMFMLRRDVRLTPWLQPGVKGHPGRSNRFQRFAPEGGKPPKAFGAGPAPPHAYTALKRRC